MRVRTGAMRSARTRRATLSRTNLGPFRPQPFSANGPDVSFLEAAWASLCVPRSFSVVDWWGSRSQIRSASDGPFRASERGSVRRSALAALRPPLRPLAAVLREGVFSAGSGRVPVPRRLSWPSARSSISGSRSIRGGSRH